MMPTNDHRSKLMSTAEAESFGAVPVECKELLRGFIKAVQAHDRPQTEMIAIRSRPRELTDEQ
jgi:hypothetical protein